MAAQSLVHAGPAQRGLAAVALDGGVERRPLLNTVVVVVTLTLAVTAHLRRRHARWRGAHASR